MSLLMISFKQPEKGSKYHRIVAATARVPPVPAPTTLPRAISPPPDRLQQNGQSYEVHRLWPSPVFLLFVFRRRALPLAFCVAPHRSILVQSLDAGRR